MPGALLMMVNGKPISERNKIHNKQQQIRRGSVRESKKGEYSTKIL